MPNIGAPELIIIAVALIVLFGATKLPTCARSIGRSMRIFKSEVKGLQKDDDDGDDSKAKATAEEPAEQQKPELTESKQQEAPASQSTSQQAQQSAEQR